MMAGMIRSAWWSVLLVAALAGAAAGQTQQAGGGVSGPWVMEQSGVTAGLRGIHAVSAEVAWASGTGGTILRTVNGGATWTRCAVPSGAEKLDFRGIWAWDAQTAIAMSSGPGDQSRLYKTVDGCTNWKMLFTNPDKDGFWDAMVFFASGQRGYLLGDPVRKEFAFFTTTDGGQTWKRSHSAGLDAGPEATGAFAASNSSLLGTERQPVAFGTGGAYFYTQSFTGTIGFAVRSGPIQMTEQWNRSRVPLASDGDAAGIFSLGWREGKIRGYGFTLLAVGGDYTKPNDSAGTAAWSADGGKTWTAAAKPPHGYRSAVGWDARLKAWITVGTNGSDISYDDGKTWVPLDDGNWNALSLPWVVGPGGRIAKLDAHRSKR